MVMAEMIRTVRWKARNEYLDLRKAAVEWVTCRIVAASSAEISPAINSLRKVVGGCRKKLFKMLRLLRIQNWTVRWCRRWSWWFFPSSSEYSVS
jgi:hypothetical protein